MCFVAAQADSGAGGAIRHPGDFTAQVDGAIASVAAVLDELGADLADIVKLDACWVMKQGRGEAQVLAALQRHFSVGVPPALFLVPLPTLATPDALIEIGAVAMRNEDGSRAPRTAGNPSGHWRTPFSHGLRCNGVIHVGTQMPRSADGSVVAPDDAAAQARITLDNIDAVLGTLGSGIEDVVNFNTRYVGGGTVMDWLRAGEIRANVWKTPGKCGTGVPVPALGQQGLTVIQEAIAVRGTDGARPQCMPIIPQGSWHWPIPVRVQQAVRIGSLLFVGGQVSADSAGGTVDAGDLVAQTVRCMAFIHDCLTEGGAGPHDLVTLKAHYRAGPTGPADARSRILEIMASSIGDAAPAVTATPVPYLGYDGGMVEIEAIAMVES